MAVLQLFIQHLPCAWPWKTESMPSRVSSSSEAPRRAFPLGITGHGRKSCLGGAGSTSRAGGGSFCHQEGLGSMKGGV
jgi:hypothetical protein